MTAPTLAPPGAPPPPGPPAAGLLRRLVTDPVARLGTLVAAGLTMLVVVPMVGLVASTLRPTGREAWSDVLTGRLAGSLLWEPLGNSLLVGTATAAGSVLLGGGLAWLVVMTDVPFRRTIGLLATVPFALPSFALALAWETVFRNDLVGGRVGVLADLGVAVPDWLAWGPVPVAATLVAHYFSLSFLLAAAALATVNGELMEAAAMTGAGRLRIARSIALPVVAPALLSGGLLAFAEGVGNFASPALLGLPVRFHTLSTRLHGAVVTGQVERGYVLSIVLVAVAATILLAGNRVVGGRRSYATIGGKGGRRTLVGLGPWRVPLTAAAVGLCLATSVLPGLVLLATSFARRTNSFTGGFTLHFWTGASDPAFAQGQRGVLRDPQIVEAVLTTVGLGLAVALAATVLGTAVGYVGVRLRGARPVTGALALLSYLPFLVPGIALGAAFIAQFGRPVGPLPALYGTFVLLVIAGTAYTLPFVAQAGRSAVGQISPDVEEVAVMAGAGLARRGARIVVPLAARGLLAGAALVFVNIVRDLSLVVLLVTPALPLLSVLTYRYAAEGFAQFANAITVIIVVLSVGATVLARRLERTARPWEETG